MLYSRGVEENVINIRNRLELLALYGDGGNADE